MRHVQHTACGTDVTYDRDQDRLYCPTCQRLVQLIEVDQPGPYSIDPVDRSVSSRVPFPEKRR